MEAKYTQDGLPVVSDETIETLNVLFFRSSRILLVDFMKILEQENPNLYSFFKSMIEFGDPKDLRKDAYIGGFYHAYESLRRQAATNSLERKIEVPEI